VLYEKCSIRGILLDIVCQKFCVGCIVLGIELFVVYLEYCGTICVLEALLTCFARHLVVSCCIGGLN